MGVLPDDWTLPAPTGIGGEWFTSGALVVQTCAECGALQHPPEEVCHACGSMSFTTTEMAPTGTVYSYTVAHYPVHRALADAVPYAVVLVSLDDAPEIRVVGNVVGVEPTDVHIDMPVAATWEERSVDGEVVQLLMWTPR